MLYMIPSNTEEGKVYLLQLEEQITVVVTFQHQFDQYFPYTAVDGGENWKKANGSQTVRKGKNK